LIAASVTLIRESAFQDLKGLLDFSVYAETKGTFLLPCLLGADPFAVRFSFMRPPSKKGIVSPHPYVPVFLE
jgi:hypothetical protein